MAKGFLIVVSVIVILMGISIVLENLPSANSSPKPSRAASQRETKLDVTSQIQDKTQTDSIKKRSNGCDQSVEVAKFCREMQEMKQLSESSKRLNVFSERLRRQNGLNTPSMTNRNPYITGTRSIYPNFSNSQPLFNSATNDMIIRHGMFTP